MRYRFVRPYSGPEGSFPAGAVLDTDDPALVERLGPDLLDPLPDRAPDAPPQDRMMRRGQVRGAGGGEVIDRSCFFAVRDKP